MIFEDILGMMRMSNVYDRDMTGLYDRWPLMSYKLCGPFTRSKITRSVRKVPSGISVIYGFTSCKITCEWKVLPRTWRKFSSDRDDLLKKMICKRDNLDSNKDYWWWQKCKWNVCCSNKAKTFTFYMPHIIWIIWFLNSILHFIE